MGGFRLLDVGICWRGFGDVGGLLLVRRLLIVEGKVDKGMRQIGVVMVWCDSGCWVGGLRG